MNKKIVFIAALFLMLPLSLFAAETAIYDVSIVPEDIENVFELVNLAVALLAAFYAVKLAALSQGGAMEKTWNLLAGVGVTFAALEVNNSLKGFGLVHLGGIDEIIELILGILLLVAVIKTRKSLLKQILGK